jgi:hypothetical protein
MESKKPYSIKMSISSHLLFYFALYFIGFIVGSSIGWVIAVILTELEIIQSPWSSLIIIGLTVLGVYIPKLIFARKVPAICPSCGGNAFLKWPSKPIVYLCADCGYTHNTKLRLGR